jgi:hypothetical protein
LRGKQRPRNEVRREHERRNGLEVERGKGDGWGPAWAGGKQKAEDKRIIAEAREGRVGATKSAEATLGRRGKGREHMNIVATLDRFFGGQKYLRGTCVPGSSKNDKTDK